LARRAPLFWLHQCIAIHKNVEQGFFYFLPAFFWMGTALEIGLIIVFCNNIYFPFNIIGVAVYRNRPKTVYLNFFKIFHFIYRGLAAVISGSPVCKFKERFLRLESLEILIENKEELHLISATAVHMEWERIFLKIDVKIEYLPGVDSKASLSFYAVDRRNRAQAAYQVTKLENGLYRLTLNITNNGANRCLPLGDYRIVVCQGTSQLATVMASPEVVRHINDNSRIFPYHDSKNAYNVFFYVAEGENDLPLIMYTAPMVNCPLDDSYSRKSQRKNPVQLLAKVMSACYHPFLRTVYKFWSFVYRKRTNTVLFISEQNSTCDGNQMAVYNRMKERNMEQQYTLLLSARMAASQRQSYGSWLTVIRKIAKSQLIFIDDHAPVFDWLKLNSRTHMVQLWHAGAGFKSAGYSRWGHFGCPPPFGCHRQYQYGIAGSRHIAPFFSEVWGILDEQVLPAGMPRMDEYLDENNRRAVTEKLYESYPMCKGKKVMLFAPTYRGKNRKTAHYPYSLLDFKRLYELCGDEWVVLFKMHPWVHDGVPIPEEYRDKFQDVGTYPNINHLFYITDLLITDYSSNIFEYSLMRKPMMFFAFDKVQYSFSRGFHRDYEESAPGKICYTFEELMDAFAAQDFEYEKVEKYEIGRAHV